jgi:hypothetical protein
MDERWPARSFEEQPPSILNFCKPGLNRSFWAGRMLIFCLFSGDSWRQRMQISPGNVQVCPFIESEKLVLHFKL